MGGTSRPCDRTGIGTDEPIWRLSRRQSLQLTLDDCLELSAAFQAIVQNTADQKEALAALLERRPQLCWTIADSGPGDAGGLAR